MNLSNMTPEELVAQKTAIQNEERKRRLAADEYRAKVKTDLEEASRVYEEVSIAYQYGGPTMHSVSHRDLANVICILETHVNNLLWLLDNA